MLANTILKRFRNSAPAKPGFYSTRSQLADLYVASWFYHQRGSRRESIHGSCMQSILYQILRQDQSVFPAFKEPYRCCEGSWDLEFMACVFRNLTENEVSLLCVIDALDESLEMSSSGDRLSLDTRDGLLGLFASVASSPGSHVKFIILSRPNQLIDLIMDSTKANLIMLQDENHDDIETVIAKGLEDLQLKLCFPSAGEGCFINERVVSNSRDTRVRAERPKRLKNIFNDLKVRQNEELHMVRTYLILHADGVMLWVTTIIELLKDLVKNGVYDFQILQENLERLPSRLDSLYGRIVNDLEQKLSEYELATARAALMWVAETRTRRPLRLPELWDALALPINENDHNSFCRNALEANMDPLQRYQRIPAKGWQVIRGRLFNICGPFIDFIKPPTVDSMEAFEEVGPSHIVQLAHQTVKDFLPNAGKLSFNLPDAERLVDSGLKSYIRVSLPVISTKYAPLPVQENLQWEFNIGNIVNYLDKKLLLSFAIAENPSAIPEMYSQHFFENSVSPPLSAWPKQTLRDKLPERKFYLLCNDVDILEATFIGGYFRYACGHGLVTAVENLLAITSLRARWWFRYHHAVLNGVLLAVIDSELVEFIPGLLTGGQLFGPQSSLSAQPADMVNGIECANHFMRLAAQTGNEKLTMAIYEPLIAYYEQFDYSGASPKHEWLEEVKRHQHVPRDLCEGAEQPDTDDVKEAIQVVMKYWERHRIPP